MFTRAQRRMHSWALVLVIAVMLGQFAGFSLTVPAAADEANASQQRQQVTLDGGDLVDVNAANKSLVLAARSTGSDSVVDPAATLLTTDAVGDSIKASLDATPLANALASGGVTGVPAGATAGDVALTLAATTTPEAGGVQARDDKGAVVLGSAPEDPKSVKIPAGGKRTDSWVFNAQGRFTFTFQASAQVTSNGKVETWQSAEVTYVVQVGGPVTPTVTLRAAYTQVGSGADVPLTATLDPSAAAGSVAFKDGDVQLGIATVSDGKATFTAKGLADGKHEITAAFTPNDPTEYAKAESGAATVRVGKAGVTVLDAGSLVMTPKLSTDQDTSECAAEQTCKPTKLTAGLVDRTAVDSSTAAAKDKPWDSQQWYAADDVVIHVPQRADGYTTPALQSNKIAGTDPAQSMPEYLGNPTPNNLLIGQGFSITNTAAAVAKGVNSYIYAKSYAYHTLKMGDVTQHPQGGSVLVSGMTSSVASGGSQDIVWDSTQAAENRDDWVGGLPWKNPSISTVPSWSFSQPGVYCVPIQMIETIKADDGDSAHNTRISTTGTYTFVVGDTVDPRTVTPCDQVPDAGTGDEPTDVVTRLINVGGHHDIRVYRPAGQNTFTFGMDASGEQDSKNQLSNIVWANPMGPTTVTASADGSADMTNIGPVGTKYWYYPTSSETNPWPGFSAESLKVSDFQSPITWRFTGFSRDGVANPTDTTVVMQEVDGLVGSDWNSRRGFPTAFQAAPKTHFHPMWAFTQPGVYCIATEATAKTTDAGWISGSGQITMVVGTHADDANIPEDLTTVTPCEKNGQPAPVATAKSVLPEATTSDVVSSLTGGQQTLVNLGWDSTTGNLDQRTDVAKNVDDMLANRVTTDPSNVILAASGYDQRDAAWKGAGFVLDTTTLQPSSLKDGTVKVTLDDGVQGPKDGVAKAVNTSNWPSPMQLSSAPGGQRSFDMVAQDSTMGSGLTWYFTKAGVYCVPVTVSAVKADGTTQKSSKTYTFIAGNTTDPKAADYVDASKVTTCSRGQTGQEAEQPSNNGGGNNGDQVTHDQIYVKNGSTTDSGAVILNQGHVDIASRLNGSTLQTWVKDSTQDDGVIRWQALAYSNAEKDSIRGKPATSSNGETNQFTTSKGVVLQTFPDAQTKVPVGSQWSFLGRSGSSIYQLPQVQAPDLLWAGWSTQAIAPEATQTGVQWTLNKVQMLDGTAPEGEFSVYETDTFGNPSQLFHASGEKISKNTFTIAKNAHVHANWAFGDEGTYCMAFTRATKLANGKTVEDAFTLAMAVGRVDVKKVDPYQCFQGKKQQAQTGAIGSGGADNTNPVAKGGAAIIDPCVVPGSGAASAVSSAQQAKTILSFGHMDWNAQLRNGKLESLIGDDSSGRRVYREPSQTLLWLKPASKVSLPSGYGAVGAAGATVWQIPQTQNASLVWLGWSTELLNAGVASSPVTWSLTSVEGPGSVKVYTTGSFGGVSEMVFNGAGSHTIALGQHVHANWAFSKQGVYRLHFTQSVRLANGQTSSDSETLTIAVGDVDPTAVALGNQGSGNTVSTGCSGGAVNAGLLGSATVDADAQAAGGETKVLPTIGGANSRTGKAGSLADQLADMTLVRLLVSGIGGLLLIGAMGAGFLWRRRQSLSALLNTVGMGL